MIALKSFMKSAGPNRKIENVQKIKKISLIQSQIQNFHFLGQNSFFLVWTIKYRAMIYTSERNFIIISMKQCDAISLGQNLTNSLNQPKL